MQEPSANTCEPASELNKPPCIKQHHHHHRSHHHHHGSIAAQVVGKPRVVHSHGLLSRYGCIAVRRKSSVALVCASYREMGYKKYTAAAWLVHAQAYEECM